MMLLEYLTIKKVIAVLLLMYGVFGISKVFTICNDIECKLTGKGYKKDIKNLKEEIKELKEMIKNMKKNEAGA